MKLIITGATGMVGSEVVNQAILDPEITEVTALVRKPLSIQNKKLNVIIHDDFLNYSGLDEVFRNHDACAWCLGISQTVVNKEEYEVVTYDYAITAATAMYNANPSMTFIFLSGMGADSTEKSRTLFARVKGKTENALMKIPFRKFYVARPAGIKPAYFRKTAPWFEKFFYRAYPFFKLVTPSFVITSEVLAKAILHMAKKGAEKTIVNSNELKKLVSG